ncbi:MAG: AEC family transporter [Eubacteriales bacterium]|nr:AEC family transporter [Eubacteriales bacterium]MDD3881394.1 AEC family transporter [Eubacteriales bacterium]MDD4513081.1 AEC family transporter [Eubacteriales bacterium]
MQAVTEVLVLFIIMLVGFLAGKLRFFPTPVLKGINGLVLNITLPCLMLAALQNESDLSLLPSLAEEFLLSLVFLLLSFAIGALIFMRAKKDLRPVYTHMVTFSNCGFMGYPVVIAVLGQAGLIYAVVYNVAFNIVIWSCGQLSYTGRVNVKSVLRSLLNPAMISALLSLVLFLLQVKLPDVVYRAFDSVGDMTTPLSMMIIGARLTELSLKHIKDFRMLLAISFRLVLLGFLAYGISYIVGAPKLVWGALCLCTIMPGSAISAMQSEAFGRGDASVLSAGGVALSTALSVATIPLMLLLLPF